MWIFGIWSPNATVTIRTAAITQRGWFSDVRTSRSFIECPPAREWWLGFALFQSNRRANPAKIAKTV
jgi:hypothetical protein